LGGILAGRLGGAPAEQFPWVFKPSQLLGVRAVPIEIDHSPERGWFRAGHEVSVRVGAPVPDQEAVTCVIPGHDRTGHEVYGETIDVDAKHLDFHFRGRCGYWSTFEYSS
jgi:hypothetical protein